MPSWSIFAWWRGTVLSFEAARTSVGHLISARRRLLSNAIAPPPRGHHQIAVLVPDDAYDPVGTFLAELPP
jgi:hypothetical protein